MRRVIIRRAIPTDIESIRKLLVQVNRIHAAARPDLFKENGIKYEDDSLRELLADDQKPIFVADNERGSILGYVFCIIETTPETPHSYPIRTLFIDDLCVEEEQRGHQIGSKLFEYAKMFGQEIGCDRMTLHVWNFNQDAYLFYQKKGMYPLVTTMEYSLK